MAGISSSGVVTPDFNLDFLGDAIGNIGKTAMEIEKFKYQQNKIEQEKQEKIIKSEVNSLFNRIKPLIEDGTFKPGSDVAKSYHLGSEAFIEKMKKDANSYIQATNQVALQEKFKRDIQLAQAKGDDAEIDKIVEQYKKDIKQQDLSSGQEMTVLGARSGIQTAKEKAEEKDLRMKILKGRLQKQQAELGEIDETVTPDGKPVKKVKLSSSDNKLLDNITQKLGELSAIEDDELLKRTKIASIIGTMTRLKVKNNLYNKEKILEKPIEFNEYLISGEWKKNKTFEQFLDEKFDEESGADSEITIPKDKPFDEMTVPEQQAFLESGQHLDKKETPKVILTEETRNRLKKFVKPTKK